MTYTETSRIMAQVDLLRTVKIMATVAKLIERGLHNTEFWKTLRSCTFYKRRTPVFDYHAASSSSRDIMGQYDVKELLLREF